MSHDWATEIRIRRELERRARAEDRAIAMLGGLIGGTVVVIAALVGWRRTHG